MSDHIERAADVIRAWTETFDYPIAEALADAGLLVTPEQQAVLAAAARVAREWKVRGDRMCDIATQDALIDAFIDLAAVDALRASREMAS